MGWWDQIQNPEKIRKTKTSYGQDIAALDQRNTPPAKETTINSNDSPVPSSVSLQQKSVRPASEPVVPNMDKYSIAAKRLGINQSPEVINHLPQKTIYKRQDKTTGKQRNEELIELVCNRCSYKVAVRNELKSTIMSRLKVESEEQLLLAMRENKELFRCTKCNSKNISVFKRDL